MHRTLALAALLLAGCPYIGEGQYTDEVRDHDGDGVIAERFGGEDCRDDDPSILTCDADGDGVKTVAAGGTDCNDDDATVFPDAEERCNGIDDDCDGLVDGADDSLTNAPGWFHDDDGDGFGAPGVGVFACLQPAGTSDNDRDCDDTRSDIHPGAAESCDALDHNCDGDPLAGAEDPVDWYRDADGDGYGSGASVAVACEAPPGTSDVADDCDDGASTTYPGAVETWYDGIDADCDGASDFDADADGFEDDVDCDDTDPTVFPGALEVCDGGVDNDCDGVADNDDDSTDALGQWIYYLDADEDGFGDDLVFAAFCPNTAPASWTLLGGDCDDGLATVLPGGTELCDDRDNDCNGVVDDGALDRVTYYLDGDGDGWGSSPVLACDPEPGVTARPGDCNDADPSTWPGAPEQCGDAFRQDCSGLSPYDCDSDGYIDVAQPGGDDCDDTRDDVYPGANEVCDGHDNNCNTLFDDDDPLVDLSTVANWYLDADGDGFGRDFLVLPNACAPVPNAATNRDDCDDDDADTYPGAPEACDEVDNSCDGVVDEAPNPVPKVFYYDADGDTFGNPAIVHAQGCTAPGPEWVEDDTDCHDGYAAVHPLALEVCDGLDNDCDALVDDADPSAAVAVWYLDNDGDGYGQTGTPLVQCTQPSGYAAIGDDCNDFEVTANPGATEVCDGGIDNDCDGLGDDADPDLAAATSWFLDADGDGYGDASISLTSCIQPAGYAAIAGDCDDARAAVSPASVEVCDGTDNDCDGDVDDADADAANQPLWFPDADADGWGSDTGGLARCTQPPGYLPQSGDCDDARDDVNPAATEVCDLRDNDCDALVDDADADLVPIVWHADADGDGFGSISDTVGQCLRPDPTWRLDASDCDDTDPAISPLGFEICDGQDNDCDGVSDDADPDVSGQPTWYADLDQDGFGAGPGLVACVAPPGAAANDLDCLDSDPSVNPSTFVELCDGVDNNCDGLLDDADPALVDGSEVWPDTDGDGFGDATAAPTFVCSPVGGTATNGDDCDDSRPAVHPAASEICDGMDNDCDTRIDDADDPVFFAPPFFLDADRDGAGGVAVGTACVLPYGFAAASDDCDDSNAAVGPLAPEVCDGVDNDCDSMIDDGDPSVGGQPLWWGDGDGDGYGAGSPVAACTAPGGWVDNGDDCDDGSATASPGFPFEICDGRDNNCDGVFDDADPAVQGTQPFFEDFDGDGFGNPLVEVRACFSPPGYTPDASDCFDNDPNIHPLAIEQCDGQDNDCDGLADDADPDVIGTTTYFRDADNDGFGTSLQTLDACAPPFGFSTFDIDCDDNNPQVVPFFGIEVCDGLDNDCNGQTDSADPGVNGEPLWFFDNDQDGYGVGPGVFQCDPPPQHVDNDKDCDDLDPDRNPDATEVCNGVDDDCDFLTDDNDPLVVGSIWYRDSDGDGYGDPGSVQSACAPPSNHVSNADDCDDFKAELYPGQEVLVGPGIAADFANIQLAMDTVCDGGVIRIAPGFYLEQLDFRGRKLVVEGLDPSDPPIIVGPGTPVVYVGNGEPPGTALRHVELQTAFPAGALSGGAEVVAASIDFVDVTFRGFDVSTRGAGIHGNNADLLIDGCFFVDNYGPGALDLQGLSNALVVDSGFSGGQGHAIAADLSGVSVIGSSFEGNTDSAEGGAIYAVNSVVDIYRSDFSDNTAPQGGTLYGRGSSVWFIESDVTTGGGIWVDAVTGPADLTVQESTLLMVGDAYALALLGPGTLTASNTSVLASTMAGVYSEGTLDLRNCTVLDNGGVGVGLPSGSGIVTNCIVKGNSPQVAVGAWSGLGTWNLFDNSADIVAGFTASNTWGDPLLQTYFPTLDPKLWDVHPMPGGMAFDQGNPGVLDRDTTRSDIGATGGPDGDAEWYASDDLDGLPDGWELFYFGDTSTQDGNQDSDLDGALDSAEFLAGAVPVLTNTDGDAYPDGMDPWPLDASLPP